MSKQDEKEQLNTILFTNLITMLSSMTMQALGKLINPGTNKAEINLDAAQLWIDTLEMLETKTAGNRTKGENQVMADILSAARMNYVETAEEQAKKKTSPEPDKEKKSEPDNHEKLAEDLTAKTDGTPEKEPKFRKSYGS